MEENESLNPETFDFKIPELFIKFNSSLIWRGKVI